MKSCNDDNRAGVPPAVLHQLNQLQPEIVSLLTHAPKCGIASLEVHFLDGEIKRIIRHREESVLLTKGETI
jgi:hypothetical protein